MCCQILWIGRELEGHMVDVKEKAGTDRRDFLKLASLGTMVGGAAVVASTNAQAEAIEAETGSGYRETVHVKTYYESVKF